MRSTSKHVDFARSLSGALLSRLARVVPLISLSCACVPCWGSFGPQRTLPVLLWVLMFWIGPGMCVVCAESAHMIMDISIASAAHHFMQ